MLLLMVDTAGTTGGVLLAQVEDAASGANSADVLGFRELASRTFSTHLIAAVGELLSGNPYRLPDVDNLAVVSGPGSFTGLRVGVSAVKGLAEALSKPVIAVSRLAVMASVAAESDLDSDAPIHAVLDAGRGEFYHGIYRNAGWERVDEALRTLEGLSAELTRLPGLIVASEPSVMAAFQGFMPREISASGARQALPLVVRNWRAGRVSDVLTLDVNYLRASDAEILARLALHAQQRNASRHSTATGSIDESAR